MAGAQVVVNGQIGLPSSRQMLAAAGLYYTATNPTIGTAIAYANKTAWSATANGLYTISNQGTKTIQLDRLKLLQTATAPTGTLYLRHEVYTETGIVVISSAAAAVTPVNVNPGYSSSTGATVTFFNAGAGTVPAAVGTRRLAGWGSLSTGVTVLGDSFTVEYGCDGPMVQGRGDTAARATDPADLSMWMPPVTIAPNTTAIGNLWWVTSATNVPSFEFILGYIEY